MDENPTWLTTWHRVDNLPWCTIYLVNVGASKNGGSNAKLGLWQAIKLL